MIQPLKAAVRPRALSPETGDSIPLDDAVRSLSETMTHGIIALVGADGSGKTTALRHLAAVLSRPDLRFVDEGLPDDVREQAAQHVIVYTTTWPGSLDADFRFVLAPWSQDDLIEYLLSVHPHRCRDVMSRVQAAADRDLLSGHPDLCRLILEELASDGSLSTIRGALSRALDQQWPDPETRQRVRRYCYWRLTNRPEGSCLAHEDEPGIGGQDPHWFSRLNHPTVRVQLAAEYLADGLRDSTLPARIGSGAVKLPELLFRALASIVDKNEHHDKLRRLFESRRSTLNSFAASLSHALDPDWRPRKCRSRNLACAHLAGVKWPGADLSYGDLAEADLARATLRDARMDAVNLTGANLRRANLRGAILSKASVSRANLSQADCSRMIAKYAHFSGIVAPRSYWDHASLCHATFYGADLNRASFKQADLRGALFTAANVDGVDFFGARLEGATLSFLDLVGTCLVDCSLRYANLTRCVLEGIELPHADFERAKLTGANLTASVMPHADFRRATLVQAGLADVQWEHADLRNADLRNCSFHLGSSRSGLVGSPYPGHGSRTGFYTDDVDEHHYRNPEEIRKANLRGADLRGARIENTDFYLVDLRGARYDAKQAEHFRRCDAILTD